MAILDLKVRIIPDMAQFKRDIQKGVTGVGGGGKKPSGKGGDVAISGFGKLLGLVGGLFVLAKSLNFIIEPVMKLLNATLALLFIPLIPILKPVLQKWGEFLRKISPGAKGLAEFFGLDEEEQKKEVKNKISEMWQRFKEFFVSSFKRALAEDIKSWKELMARWRERILVAGDLITSALTSVRNAIIRWINIFLPKRFEINAGVAPSPNASFASPGEGISSFPTTNTVNINNPVVQNSSDINKIADAVSKVLRLAQTKTFLG